MSSVCRNYTKCLHSLETQNDHHGLCIECFQACQDFIVSIQEFLGGHKLAIEDEIYLFLHRSNTLDDLARHLETHKLTAYLPTSGTFTNIRQYFPVVEAALLCLRFRDTITEEQLIELVAEKDEEENESDCEDGVNCPDKQIEPNEIEAEIDSKEDSIDEDNEEPILSEVCPVEVMPVEIISTEEPGAEEIVECQTTILQPEMIAKPVNRVPIFQSERNARRQALRLIAKTIENRKLPRKYEDFITTHMGVGGCNALELDGLLDIVTTRNLIKHGQIQGRKLPPRARFPHGEWCIAVVTIIQTCDRHENWVSIPQAVKKIKIMNPGIKIDRNTLRKYVLKEGLCEHSTNLSGELAIPVAMLSEIPGRYQEIQTRLKKKKGVHKDAPKRDELTPMQIYHLLNKKIPYKTLLIYLIKGIIPGEKRHGRWVSTTAQYNEFLHKSVNGVRGMRPEHILACRIHL